MSAEPKPKVRVKPYSYQPSKAEIEEDVSVDATPEEVRAALMRPVIVRNQKTPDFSAGLAARCNFRI